MNVTVIPAQFRHIQRTIELMRQRDVKEIWQSHGVPPEVACAQALTKSYRAITMLHGLTPLCMAGLSPCSIAAGSAIFWIFATAEIDSCKFAFARACKRTMPALFAGVRFATNFVAADDEPAIKWAQWLGVELLPGIHMRGGRAFRQFVLPGPEMGREACRLA